MKRRPPLILINPPRAWDWFQQHQEKLRYPSRQTTKEYRRRQRVFQEEIRFAAFEHLFIEIIADELNHRAQLIISAHGNTKLFDAVELMVLSAPVIEGWEYIGFYPPALPQALTRHNYPSVTIPPDQLFFSPAAFQPQNGRYNLQLYTTETITNQTEWNGAATQMMFNLLGEKTGGLCIRQVKVATLLPGSPQEQQLLVPFTALRDYLPNNDDLGLKVSDTGKIK